MCNVSCFNGKDMHEALIKKAGHLGAVGEVADEVVAEPDFEKAVVSKPGGYSM